MGNSGQAFNESGFRHCYHIYNAMTNKNLITSNSNKKLILIAEPKLKG
jgi:hypothetical protein